MGDHPDLDSGPQPWWISTGLGPQTKDVSRSSLDPGSKAAQAIRERAANLALARAEEQGWPGLCSLAELLSRLPHSDAIRMRLEQHGLGTVDAVDEITRRSGTT